MISLRRGRRLFVAIQVGVVLGAAGTALGNAGSTTRVSVDSAGAQGNGRSGNADDNIALSSDGRYVVFESIATNLVAGDTNALSDIFVRDRQTGATTRMSVVNSTGAQAIGGASVEPAISPDGRWVAFRSDATNLVTGDTNATTDIFVHDRQGTATIRVSVDTAGAQANGPSSSVSISTDGRYVAFESVATNLVATDTNNASDIFVRDRDTDGNGIFDEAGGVATTRVSLGPLAVAGNDSSRAPSISGDGRFVAFESDATNLVAGDTNSATDIFVRDRQTSTTTRVSVATGGTQSNGNSREPSISAGGRFVAYESDASNLVAGDTNAVTDIFAHDRQTTTTARVSVSSSGTQADFASNDPMISSDARYTTFRSNATNLVAGDTNARTDVFVYDGVTSATARVSVDGMGTQANGNSFDPAVSSSGQFVVFSSIATNLITGDTNGASDVFFRDLIDSIPPVITCSTNLVRECTGASGASVSYTTTATDNCDPSPIVSCAPASGATFAIATTTVNCTATDATGNSSACSFTVTVRDTVAPTITCPTNASSECTGPSGAPVTFTATATDTCDASPSVVCAPASGSTFAIGTTTVNCTATDASSNASSCSFTVSIADTTAPAITCPANLVRQCTSSSGAPVTFTVTATDTCDSTPTVSCVPASGSIFAIGTTTVDCTATDDSTNASGCSFTVTVRDTTPPAITCSANLTRECAGISGAPVTYTVTANDACDPNPLIVCAPSSGSVFSFGTTTVNCSATDGSSNSSSCSFTVTVVDTTAPTISCPNDFTRECTSAAGAPVTFSPTAVDACDPVPGVSCVPPSGSTFAMGTTTVHCTATDASGNSQTCSFIVAVGDSNGPTVQCPVDLTRECTSSNGATVSFTVTATDACDPNPTVGCVPSSGSLFPIGQTSVTCTATDASSNVGACSFTVTVGDTTAPSVQCSGNLTRECTSPSGATVTFSVTASDACDPIPSIVCAPASGSVFAIGTTNVTCTARDAANNAAICSFDVTVSDTTPPTIQCTGDRSAVCEGPSGATVTFDVTATDLCDPSPAVACTPPSGSVFPIGQTTVNCTATDAGNQSASCSFVVTVGSITLLDVRPGTGSESGADLVKIDGCGFTTVGDTTVTIGGASATIVSVTSTQMQVRTPPGSGTADVSVTNSNGTSTLPGSYSYIAPEIAVRLGNVNVALGDRENVLTINSSIGGPTREVTVPVDTLIRAVVVAPTSRTTSRFVIYAWPGVPGAGNVTPQPAQLGSTIFPTPLTRALTPQPFRIWNNIGNESQLGVPTYPSNPAPSTLFNVAHGLRNPLVAGFQGFIRDDGAGSPRGFSVTNAVILRVTR
ncbi:MAG: HYR domain-containing protein [Planctomycetes bacterium]|nr:HYR domain-containing protein [Planctomycetota bacterium]MBI3847980.1 HYR domain-containing protein [Planctomycetota bacterium]